MTNKLRSVIYFYADLISSFSELPKDFVQDVKVVAEEVAHKQMLELSKSILDALIEEMEEDDIYNESSDDPFKTAFDNGCFHMIYKLKQAREELSTI